MKFIGIVILLFAFGCKQKFDKRNWPYPEARKCADYYKDLAEVYKKVIPEFDIRIEDAIKEGKISRVDTLYRNKAAMIREQEVLMDSAYYFYKIIDGN